MVKRMSVALCLMLGLSLTACNQPVPVASGPSQVAISSAVAQHRPVFVKFYMEN